MNWELKETKKKVDSAYKTLYMSVDTIKRIENIAQENNTSFNNVIVSMIESCLEGEKNS